MKTKNQSKALHRKPRQRGAALIILMLAIVLSLVTLVTFRSERKGPEQEAQRKTALALAQAKEALLGRATANDDPGTLSCPSNDLNGVAVGCPGAPPNIPPYAGRFPWRTLGVGNLYDGAGERLWYVMSEDFVDNGKSIPPSTPTLKTISVNGGASNVVAVIIAPGAPVNGQNRSTGNVNIMNNYIESYVGATNINTALSPGNDQIITITTSELYNVVTQRMAREFALQVTLYFDENGTYPPTGWVRDNIEPWMISSHFAEWVDPDVTVFTRISIKQGTLRFPPCVGEFNIQRVISQDVVSGKVVC